MSDQESEVIDKKPIVIKNATDLQRLKLEKLMKNPVGKMVNNLNKELIRFIIIKGVSFIGKTRSYPRSS